MKTKVIFTQNLVKVGKVGEIKEVATSYALNVLIPKKYAILASPEAIRGLEQGRKNKENQKTLERVLFSKAMSELEEKLRETGGFLEITGQKNKNGHLFAKISAQDVVEAIFKKINISLDPSQIILPREPIKQLGEYQVEIKNQESKKKFKILVK